MGTILIIDTERGFEERFKRRLDEEDLLDRYQLATIMPDTTLDIVRMTDLCVHKIIEYLESNIDVVVLVDIVIYERETIDKAGVGIAVGVKSARPDVPVFCITSKVTGDAELDIFSETTLEDIDGVFGKSFLDGNHFSGKRLRKILESGLRKCNHRISRVNVKKESSPPVDIYNAFCGDSLDPVVASNIDKLGGTRFWNLIGKIFPGGQGAIMPMQSGRSGAQVFRILSKKSAENTSTTATKDWLLKVDTDAELLAKEARSHHALIHTSGGREHFPRLLHMEPLEYDGLWAIAYDFEVGTHTLQDYLLAPHKREAIEAVGRSVVELLISIYGDPYYQIKPVWSAYYNMDKSLITSILAFITKNTSIINEVLGPEVASRVSHFVMENGNALSRFVHEVDTRNIHGDLNSCNILVTENGAIRLIDFALRQQSHVPKDIAKLERDLLFRVLDCGSKKYSDWSRLSAWRIFTILLKVDNILSPVVDYATIPDDVVGLIQLTVQLRTGLKASSPKLTDSEYLISLLYHVLLSTLNTELPIQKRVFAVEYADAIIDRLTSY